MAITSANQLELLQTAEAVAREKMIDPVLVVEAMEESLELGRGWKKKKAPGPDNITNEMLQHLGPLALRKLLEIFNLSLEKGEVPQCWKEARMVPILKKGKNT